MSRPLPNVDDVKVGQRYERRGRVIEVVSVPHSPWSRLPCTVRNVETGRRTCVTRESLRRYYRRLLNTWPDGEHGGRTGVPCPRCGAEIAYSGNYFCERWDVDCDWALSDDGNNEPEDVDQPTWRAIQERWTQLTGHRLVEKTS